MYFHCTYVNSFSFILPTVETCSLDFKKEKINEYGVIIHALLNVHNWRLKSGVAGLVKFMDLSVSFTEMVMGVFFPAGRALYRDVILETYTSLVSGCTCCSPWYLGSDPQTTFPVS